MDEFEIPSNIRPSYMEPLEDELLQQGEIDSNVVKNIEEELDKVRNPEGERIKTFLRIRTHTSKSRLPGVTADQIFEIETPTTLLVKQPADKLRCKNSNEETRFTFSRILGPDRTQSSVFEECVHPIVDKFFEGENCLVFSYGATNSGKTFTMQGYGANFGVVPRTLEYLYNRLEDSLYGRGDIKPNQFDAHCELDNNALKALEENKQRVLREAKIKANDIQSFRESCVRSSSAYSMSSDVAHHNQIQSIKSVPVNFRAGSTQGEEGPLYSVWVSFAEIYNERVYDLFEVTQKGKKRKDMKLYEDKRRQVFINDLTEFCVRTAEEAYQLFLAGRENLKFASTQMNSNSSRSHSFFNLRMVSLGCKDGYVYPMRVYRLSFCDLAGIERVSQTGNAGLRLKESGNINQSLLVLLRCIRAMRDKQQGKMTSLDILPFRESKLARLFKSYLTTSNHIRMIVTINPDPRMFDSTMQVLINSAVASKVQLVSRVEAPVFNTNFCRKVRHSLGLVTKVVEEEKKPEKQEGEESEYASADEEVDDSDKICLTVIPKQTNLTAVRVELQEREISELKEQLRNLEEVIREEMHEKYSKIFQEQEDSYKKLLDETMKRSEEVNQCKIDLAAECFRKFPDAILNGTGTGSSATSPMSLILNSSVNYSAISAMSFDSKKSTSVGNLEKDQELAEALELCQGYHQKLDEANVKINALQDQYNTLYNENIRMKEEEEYLHLTIDDLQAQLEHNKLLAENNEKKANDWKRRAQELGDVSGMALETRARRNHTRKH